MNLNVQTAYVSCGCNKVPHAADWGKNGLICFGSCNSVVIYDPMGGKIIHTLNGHRERVNSVRWVKDNLQTREEKIVSASADGSAILWSWNEKNEKYILDKELKGHTNIVNVADGFINKPLNHQFETSMANSFLIATSSVDSTVMIWEANYSNNKIDCVDIIKWASGFCLDVKLSIFPETNIALLACSVDDNHIHIFAECKKSELDDVNYNHKFYKIHIISGHEDWIRSMDILLYGKDLFLATGSQDTFIRVHKFERKEKFQSKLLHDNFNSKELEHEKKIIKVGSKLQEYYFTVVLETILAGHEGWIYGVSWYNSFSHFTDEMSASHQTQSEAQSKKLKLLSSSIDKTIIVWSPDDSGIWTEEARVGEIGGCMLGFYGGKFGPDGKRIMGHGYQGSFHIWVFNEINQNWEPQVVIGGHSSEVTDLAWDIKGNYILSVGGDQTTRLHAPWVRDNGKTITWHEIARPQIHGYDLTCLAVLSQNKFASGAEEKVIRAFTAPNNFVENFKRICDIKEDLIEMKVDTLPLGASVPALGLSNKPVFVQMKKEGFLVDDEYPDLYFSPIYLTCPPTEENLMQNTLWPEAQKLYGHGYEIYSLAARGDGVILASACKATTPEHAVIILWNAKTWLQIQKLTGHQLTVTQMSFSPDGKYLLSVGRDRRWCLFAVNEDFKTYELFATSDVQSGFHTRVIWCCAWTFDSSNFATGSRDGKIGVWTFNDSRAKEIKEASAECMAHLEISKESITALSFAPSTIDGFYILAVGLESGQLLLYQLKDYNFYCLNVSINSNWGHDLAIKRLAFRPVPGRTGIKKSNCKNDKVILQLASCGLDHAVKVYDLFWDAKTAIENF